ncbi:hypothetical protein [Saccharopolyspora sp. ASAGF58]|uniref:hypothetical protein n=2 Tax=Saccharopolyspora TaxID=1835 RepID=UPI0014451E8E|nr:hypothetical protein [Saccharopolyspora sp. ASAGF58]
MIPGGVIHRHVGAGRIAHYLDHVRGQSPAAFLVPGTARAAEGGRTMFSGQHVALVESTALDGWVGPSAILAGLLLLIVALFRRTRATLAKKRRAARPSAAEWW